MLTCNMPGTSEGAIALLGLNAPSRVLDLGCYHGDVSLSLLAQGHQVSSCDIVAYEGTRRLPDFRVVDANQLLPYADASFDAILCTEVIEHLENPTNLVRECARVLSDGGTLILSTPNVGSLLSRLIYLKSGEFPLFRAAHFAEWGHISPIPLPWLTLTARKYSLRINEVTSERGPVGPKRKLFWRLARCVIPLFWRKQAGVGEVGHSILLRLTKEAKGDAQRDVQAKVA